MAKKSEKKKNTEVARAAATLSKIGARKGGLARVAQLTKKERSELGRRAILARWAKYREKKKSEQGS